MGITLNQFDDLNNATWAGWTQALSGTASRTLTTITSGGGSLYYHRNDLNLDGPNAWQLEAVLQAEGLSVDAERGARMWVKFTDTGALPSEVYFAEVRLVKELGTNKIKLFNGHSGVSLTELTVDWSGAPIRVRIKRQQVTGTDYIFLQAEAASSWDDKVFPNNLNDPPNSMAVPLGSFTAQFDVNGSQIGFGNFIAGSYYSDWYSVHMTRGDTVTDVLPYWPPAPSAPTLSLNGGSSNPQEIQAQVDTSSGFLANDRVRGELVTAKNGTQNAGAQATGGTVTFVYQNLSDDQDVTGTVIAVEASGRETTGPASLAYTIPDLTAPAQPAITSPASGTITNDQTPAMTGTAEANSTVEIFDDTGSGPSSIGTTTADGTGGWSFTPGANLTSGSHTLTCVATDGAGNPSVPSAGVDLEIDITAPAPPVIVTPLTGTYTNDQTPTLTGTAEADSTVEVFYDWGSGPVSLGTVSADGSGNWSFTPGANLPQDTYTFTAKATDAASNPSASSAGVVVTVDIVAPAQPAITSPASGTFTNDQTPTLDGTAEASSSVEVFYNIGSGPVSLGTVPADGSGNWTFTPGANLPEDTYTFTVKATDAAGNPSVSSSGVVVTIDIQAPAQPVITSPASGTETNDQTPTVTGTAEPNASVEVRDGGIAIDTVTADGAGNWTYTPGSNLSESSHTFTVVATDAASNPSPESAPVVIVVDITAPAAPVISDPDPAYYHWTNNTQPPLTGTAEADATVEVFYDIGSGPVSLGTTTADSAGDWTFTPPAALPDDVYAFTVTATDAAGNPSAPSTPAVDVEIYTTLPDGEIQVSTAVGAPFDPANFTAPTPGQTFNVPIEVGVRVTQATKDYLDYVFSSNPLVAQNPTHQPPSMLQIQLPAAGSFTDHYLDETNDFAIYPIGSPTTTHWMFVFKDGGSAHRVFTEDGDLLLQAFLQDFATNSITLPAAPPLTLDIDIPPEGEIVLKIGASASYGPVTTPILTHPVIPAVQSAHADVDGPNSSITITENNSAQTTGPLPLGAGTQVGNNYIHEPTNLASFPAGATIDTDGDYTITATIQDGDTPPNTNTIPINATFLVDTVIPSAECWVADAYAGPYALATTTYSSGPKYVALAVDTSVTDLDEATSVFNVQPTATAGPLNLDDASLSPIVQGSKRLYRWPTEFTGPGQCTIEYQLWDTPAGQTLGPQQCAFSIGQPQFEISSGNILLSHTHDDGTHTDPANEMYNGNTNNNYLGVRIRNTGTGAGDCSYRLFVVPKCLFTNVSDWLLVDVGNPAPVVTGIAGSGGEKNSTGNTNFQQPDPAVPGSGHPNFPSDVDLFGAGASLGSIVHTCTAAVLHSTADPLVLLDSGGNPVPYVFDDPAQFVTTVMTAIQGYNGGGYWTAVSQNPKIANKNFNFKKVV